MSGSAKNFRPKDYPLSKQAVAILKNVDGLLNNLGDKVLNKVGGQITLYGDDWKRLENELSELSRGKVSLKTHRYRGLRLVRAQNGTPWA